MGNNSINLPEGWATYSVLDLVNSNALYKPLDGNHGSIHPKQSDYVDNGIPFIMASDLENGRVNFHTCSHISIEQARILRKGFALEGDVLLTHKATIGRTAIVQEMPYEFIVLTPQVTYYRVKDYNKINNKYLKYYFDGKHFQGVLSAWAGSGSTRSYIGITQQLELPIIIPSIEQQKAIACILGALDDKIELNQKTNQTLEEMARNIFKSWFVDFDPVRSKAAAQEPPGMAPHIANLFPASFEESEFGEIPAGWRVQPIGELVRVFGGGTPSTKEESFWGGEHPFCTPKDMSLLKSPILLQTQRGLTDAGLAKVSSGKLPKGTVLLSSRAPIGYIAISDIPVTINQGIIALVCHQEVSNAFVLIWLQLNMNRIIAKANGSTFLEISKQNFRSIKVLYPDYPLLKSFQQLVDPIINKIMINEKQNQTLADIRDCLLIRLFSGELPISSAESIVRRCV